MFGFFFSMSSFVSVAAPDAVLLLTFWTGAVVTSATSVRASVDTSTASGPLGRDRSLAGLDSDPKKLHDEIHAGEMDSAPKPAPQKGETYDTPGEKDDLNFEQHWTVAHWRDYYNGYASGFHTLSDQNVSESEVLRDFLDNARQVITEEASRAQTAGDAAYWAYHLFRLTFFASYTTAGLVRAALQSGLLQTEGSVQFIEKMPVERAHRTLMFITSDVLMTFKVDLKLINEGVYKLPWDMTTSGHRQFNPFWVAENIFAAVATSTQILIQAGKGEGAAQREHGSRLPFLQSDMYPRYYQNDFHFQEDGWFSSKSAEVYDALTEGIFFGRQDAMQRTALIPIARHLPGSKGEGLSMLEVGAGTGRFATFLRDNYPHATLTISDLSPFYLQQAREQMQYWEDKRGGGVNMATGAAKLLQCAAERIPVATSSQDVVYTVYVFHEMPLPAQRAALKEFARVLKPGGLLVVTDSGQLGDRPQLDNVMDNFSGFNEPHYSAYVRLDFGAEFKAVGLRPDLKCLQSATKTISAVKPRKEP